MFSFLTDEQNSIITKNTQLFKGHMNILSAALGAIVLGHQYGWRVLKIVHSPATLKKYETIIGLKYEEICPETTELSDRNVGFRIYKKIGAFWKIVLGHVKVENKSDANDDKE
jgi:hypothetical protein